MKRIATISDVAERQLCTGCGACAFVQPEDIEMVDDVDHGRRPIVRSGAQSVGGTDAALAACPGIGLAHEAFPAAADAALAPTWGPVLEVWEGAASDHDLRFEASSGGISSALAIFAIEHGGFGGLLHIRARDDVPYLNETTVSRTRAEIVAAVGSRYAPASPLDGLASVVASDRPMALIGKPCDIAGAVKAARVRPELNERLGLTIGIFCAGTPSLRGTFEMLATMGVADPTDLRSLRYRGLGWPGRATAVAAGGEGELETHSMSYEESWGAILQRHRQWRCYVCADHTGEFADVSVGDPWHTPPDGNEPGRSLVLIRTERGRSMFHAAMDAGVITADRRDPGVLPAAQPWLGRVRGEAGARAATLRLFGIPAPVYRNMPTWPAWWRNLTFRDKVRSTLGTVRRLRRKGLLRRHVVVPLDRSAREPNG